MTIKPYVARQGTLNVAKKYVGEKSFTPSNQEDIDRSGCCNSGCCRADNDCCTHWGLKRWFYGIKEYVIDRCLCCTMCGFKHMDEDRTYIEEENSVTTDCACVAFTPSYGGFLHNNPVTGTLCFPLAITMHLLCLPCACCSPHRDDWWLAPHRIKEIEKENDKQYQDEEMDRHRKVLRKFGLKPFEESNAENMSLEELEQLKKSYEIVHSHMMYKIKVHERKF